MINKILLSELNRRKEKAIKELEVIQEAKRNVSVADKRTYTALRSKIKKLEHQIANMGKEKDRIIAVQREELKQFNADAEISPQTEIEEESDEPYSEDIDIYDFIKHKGEKSTEIKHIKFTAEYNQTPRLNLIREHKELFIDE